MARVLIVEDDANLRRLYRISLTFAGFDVDEAGNGFTALNSIEQHPPDLVPALQVRAHRRVGGVGIEPEPHRVDMRCSRR